MQSISFIHFPTIIYYFMFSLFIAIHYIVLSLYYGVLFQVFGAILFLLWSCF